MRKHILVVGFLALMTAAPIVVSCVNDDRIEQIQESSINFNFVSPELKSFKTIEIEILEINSGQKRTFTVENKDTYSLKLPYGSYKITANGTAINTENEEVQVGATVEQNITTSTTNIQVNFAVKQFSEDFIIEEVFFTGVKSAEGKQYNSGKYFKLTNNTDKVLYADGLLIAQSNFLTTTDLKPTPYDKEKYFYVKGVLMLPGSGTQYPVQPGDFIVIADNAVNHKEKVSTAYDLSKANFEFPVINNTALGQIDNPSVPNAETIYVTANFVVMHNRGFESYAIARLPQGTSKETFLANHKYDYEYVASNGKTIKRTAMKIPNEWIIDAQNNSIEAKFVHTLTGAALDAGWTACGKIDSDDTRYGKSVRRKILGKSSTGKNIYKDTNNSTVDFTKDSEPSLKNGIVH